MTTTTVTTDTPAAVEPEEPCEHRWRVTSFEATTQIVGHRCERCGVTTLERPQPTEARRGMARQCRVCEKPFSLEDAELSRLQKGERFSNPFALAFAREDKRR